MVSWASIGAAEVFLCGILRAFFWITSMIPYLPRSNHAACRDKRSSLLHRAGSAPPVVVRRSVLRSMRPTRAALSSPTSQSHSPLSLALSVTNSNRIGRQDGRHRFFDCSRHIGKLKEDSGELLEL